MHNLKLNNSGQWILPAYYPTEQESYKAGNGQKLDGYGRWYIPEQTFSEYNQAMDYIESRSRRLKQTF